MKQLFYEMGMRTFASSTETLLVILYMVILLAVASKLTAMLMADHTSTFKHTLVTIVIGVAGYIPIRMMIDTWFFHTPGWIETLQYLVKYVLTIPVTLLHKPVIAQDGTILITAVIMIVMSTLSMIRDYVAMALHWVPLDVHGQQYVEMYKDRNYEYKMVKLAQNYLGMDIKIHRILFTRYIRAKDAALLENVYFSLKRDDY